MYALKQIPLISLPSNSNINHNLLRTPSQLENKKTHLHHKLRISSHNNNSYRVQENISLETRLSHQQTGFGNPFSSKIKRRISTAGASKRFPKDFFRCIDGQNMQRKSPALVLKWKRNLVEIDKIPLEQKRKQYKLNIDLHLAQHSTVNTPKFNQPQASVQLQNQFLEAKPVSHFPRIQELNLQTCPQIKKKIRPAFIKKVKKGQYLRYKIQLNRSISQNNNQTQVHQQSTSLNSIKV